MKGKEAHTQATRAKKERETPAGGCVLVEGYYHVMLITINLGLEGSPVLRVPAASEMGDNHSL